MRLARLVIHQSNLASSSNSASLAAPREGEDAVRLRIYPFFFFFFWHSLDTPILWLHTIARPSVFFPSIG